MDFDVDNQSLIGIFTTDAKFIVQIWDAALEQMTGISTADARGKPVIEIIPELEARGFLSRFERVIEQGTVELLAPTFHRFLIPCAPRFSSKHFAEMRQRVTIAPLREDESILGLIVSIEDVTGRMERETELTEKLKSADQAVRLEAAKAISSEPENLTGDNAAPVIQALGDKNWRVRRELIEGLSRRAAPDAIAALLRAMQEKHFDFAVLNSALQVLQATSVKTTETIIEFLKGEDADLRMQAALTLGEQKDSAAIPALLEALRDENENVRYHAIEALGKLKAEEAVKPLLEIAETRDFFLSFVALDALSKIGNPVTAARILPLLSDEFLRLPTIETLGLIGDEKIVAPLVSILNEDTSSAASVAGALASIFEKVETDFSKSSAIIELVRNSISATGKSNLLEALDNSNEIGLTALIIIGGWLDDEEIREKIADLLEDENVREAAAAALRQQGPAAVSLLIEKLTESDPEVCRTAARTLGQIGDMLAFEPLIELLLNGSAASRTAAVTALKLLAHPQTGSRLYDFLTAADANIREAAIRIVGSLGAKNCEDVIFESCADADERIRRAAIEQLPNVADERAVPTLIQALKYDSSRVRETAAKALAQVKNDESIAALREALTDDDSWTRYFAIRALGTANDTASREIIFEMAEKDPAEYVRAAAREILNELKL